MGRLGLCRTVATGGLAALAASAAFATACAQSAPPGKPQPHLRPPPAHAAPVAPFYSAAQAQPNCQK